VNTYKVKWADGVTQTREATDMMTLLTAMILGEGKKMPVSIKQIVKVK
jgi:hypothetical protein